MSKVFYDKIHARTAELQKVAPEGSDVTVLFFKAAHEVKDEMQKMGLLNSVKALDVLIEKQMKLLSPEMRAKVETELELNVFDLSEL